MTSLVKLTYLGISQEIRLQDLPFYHPQHVGFFFFFFIIVVIASWSQNDLHIFWI